MEVGTYRGGQVGRYGLGINRSTWNFGRRIGTLAKRGINSYFKNKKRKATSSSQRSAKRSRSTIGQVSAIPGGGGDSESSFTLVNPMKGKLPPVAKEFAPSFVVQNESGRTECTVGKQNFAVVGTYYNDVDVNNAFTLLNSSAAAKIMLDAVHGETLITNQENVNARMTIYDIICKKQTDATVTDPLVALTAGYVDNNGGAATDYLIPGVSVYSNPRFVEYFKVLKQTEVVLHPGSCHSHKVHYKPNRYFSHELSSNIVGDGIAGLTVYTVIQYHGTPINDITTQTQVSLSHISLDWVQKEQYRVVYLHASASSMQASNTLPLAFTVAGNVMEDDGVVRAEVEA